MSPFLSRQVLLSAELGHDLWLLCPGNFCAEPETCPTCSSARGLSQTFLMWKVRILLLGNHLWKKVKSMENPVALAFWMMSREQWGNPRETSTFFSLSLLLIFAVEWNEDWRKVKMMNRWERERHCFHWEAASSVLHGKTRNPFQVIPAGNLTSVSFFSRISFSFLFLLKIYLVSFYFPGKTPAQEHSFNESSVISYLSNTFSDKYQGTHLPLWKHFWLDWLTYWLKNIVKLCLLFTQSSFSQKE